MIIYSSLWTIQTEMWGAWWGEGYVKVTLYLESYFVVIEKKKIELSQIYEIIKNNWVM